MSDGKPPRRCGDTPQPLDNLFHGDHEAKCSLQLPNQASIIVATSYARDCPMSQYGYMEADLDYPAIAARMKTLRLERKENQYDVAAAAEVSRVTVTEWEGGRKKPSREKLVAVANHFGVPVDFILYGDRRPGSVKIQSKEEERVVLLLRQVAPEVRQAVQTLLENSAEVPGRPFKE